MAALTGTLDPGIGTVRTNVARVLIDLFTPTAVSLIALVIFRDELRARLRETWPDGVPLFTGGRAVLVGSGHLVFAAGPGEADPAEVERVVAAARVGITPQN